MDEWCAPATAPVSQIERSISKTVLRTLRFALSRHMSRVDLYHISPADEPPALPDFESMRQAGIPLVDEDQLYTAFAGHGDHRKLLNGFLQSDGWTWGD